MAGLTNARVGVAEDLTNAGLRVVDHLPERITPPLVVIGLGDPYVEESDSFDNTEFVVRLSLGLIVGASTNAVASRAIDTMIETVLFNLGDWTIDNVEQPGLRSYHDSLFLTSIIDISNTINITV